MATTLEILAPYLPYEIEVDWLLNKPTPYSPVRNVLTGLVTPSSTCYLDGKYTAYTEDVLPVLRPFSQLVESLPDGMIPAVEVARMMWGTRGVAARWNKEKNEARVFGEDGRLLVYLSENFYRHSLSIVAFEYLRSKHFALPVHGRPLVEGVDFVAKEPTPAATTEKGASHE